MACTACATLPAPLVPSGKLYLAAPEEVLFETVLSAARALAPLQPATNVLAIDLTRESLDRICAELANALSTEAQARVRYVIAAEGEVLDLGVMGRMEPFTHLLARAEKDWLVELIRDERLTTHFQPIVNCQDPTETFAFECLLRGSDRSGAPVSPGRMFEAARDGNLLFNLDRLARLSAIRCASEQGIDRKIFVNFNPTSIYNPNACLGSTFAAISKAQIAPENVIFEIVESDRISDGEHLSRIVDRYREAGFCVALDDLGSAYSGLDLLQKLKPDYVKLDMGLIRDIDRHPFKQHVVAHLLAMSRDLGVVTVAEGIETEAEWEFVRKHGADLAQGWLFGKAGAVPIPGRLPIGSAPSAETPSLAA